MQNKCQKCGHICNENDIYCSRCGNKLSNKNEVIANINKFEKFCKNQNIKNAKNASKLNFKKISNNLVLSVSIFLLMMVIAVSILMFFILNKHNSQREALQYKNLIANPAQIPLLSEPKNYEDLKNNLDSVEKFLLLYLKETNDSKEKKEQIFHSYLKEMEKLPNILNEKYADDNIVECRKAKNISACSAILNRKFSNSGIDVYTNAGMIYLYPDYKKIKSKYYKFLTRDYKKYMTLKAKYNSPVSIGLDLYIGPKNLASRIYDFEKMYYKISNSDIKEDIEQTLYMDVRKFIFTPSIYSTITQEMTNEFKDAYIYFINSNKNSMLRPLIMSYMDKKRSYGEDNFINDYPFKKIDNTKFEDNVNNSKLEDIFVQLRKNIFQNVEESPSLSYVYSLQNGKWRKYSKELGLSQGEYVICEPDENNNVAIYNNMFSPMQELNILKYSKLYLINNNLYVFNKDKLSLSKVTFNGKTFGLYNLAFSDISSIFPGIEVINMDTFQSYNILIEKDNAKAAFIIMSRYSQGWNNYNIEVQKGNVNYLTLPNMFSVESVQNALVLFKTGDKQAEELYESAPAYKFTIVTRGEKENEKQVESYSEYDKKTEKEQEENELHKPNIMPKLLKQDETTELQSQDLLAPPEQKIDPPKDDE